MSHSDINFRWAWNIVATLYQYGVRDFVLASGSRNAPLVMAAAQLRQQRSGVRLFSHFDERGAAFFALGCTKASERPTAVITTSGSAVANLHPAAVEAFQQHQPIIFISADRPEELIHCGANQAINQPGSLSPHIVAELDLQAPDDQASVVSLRQQLYELMSRCLAVDGGPVFINCPFREPLYEVLSDTHWPLPEVEPVHKVAGTIDMTNWPPSKKPLLVAGQLNSSDALAVLHLAEQKGWPLITDIGSQLHLRKHPNLVHSVDGLLTLSAGKKLFNEVDQVIQFGGRLTSKKLNQWLAEFAGDYRLVSVHSEPLDPSRRACQQQANIADLCVQLATHQSNTDEWLQQWQPLQQQLFVWYQNHLADWNAWTLAHRVTELLPKNMALFAGNSMSVRLLNQVSVSQGDRSSHEYTNRGASGIDGLLATALGCAQYHRQGLTMLLGDLSLLHDLNSFALCKTVNVPMVIVVINDDGGSIFNLLPVTQFPDLQQEFFQAPHGLNFQSIASMFNLPYYQPGNEQSFTSDYQSALQQPGCSLIECQFEHHQAANFLHQMQQQLAELDL